MRWIKQGLIFTPDHTFDWMVSHASLPVVDPIRPGVLRLHFGARNADGRSLPAFIDVAANEPRTILHVHDQPILPLGQPGTFDDNGIMPSWLVEHAGRKFLYYIGWNPQVTVAYRLAIGLALSTDGGETYHKYSEGPICDRAVDEPYFNTAPCVLHDGGVWRMWYVSCTGWEMISGRPEPRYHVKYAESADGFCWQKTGRVCIDYDEFTQAIGRPCVFKEGGLYQMLYSYRRVADYRTDRQHSYRLGYAESGDGLEWRRKDDEAGIARAEHGWDSEMMEYSFVHEHHGTRYLFYNGNGFGRSGLGYAVEDKSVSGGGDHGD